MGMVPHESHNIDMKLHKRHIKEQENEIDTALGTIQGQVILKYLEQGQSLRILRDEHKARGLKGNWGCAVKDTGLSLREARHYITIAKNWGWKGIPGLETLAKLPGDPHKVAKLSELPVWQLKTLAETENLRRMDRKELGQVVNQLLGKQARKRRQPDPVKIVERCFDQIAKCLDDPTLTAEDLRDIQADANDFVAEIAREAARASVPDGASMAD